MFQEEKKTIKNFNYFLKDVCKWEKNFKVLNFQNKGHIFGVVQSLDLIVWTETRFNFY